MSGIDIASGLLDDFTEIKVKELIELRPWMRSVKFILLTSCSEVEEYIDKCIKNEICACDVETTGLNTRLNKDGKSCSSLVGVCLSCDPDEGIYIPIAHYDAEEYNVPLKFMIQQLSRLAANCVLIFHNFKFDGEILRNYGVIIDGFDKYEDTLIMAAIEDASRKDKSLKGLSEKILGRPQLEIGSLGIQGTKKKTICFPLVPPQKAVYYGGSDGMNTYALFQYFRERLNEQDPLGRKGPWSIYRIEKRCLFVTMAMERSYVKIDKKYLSNINIDLQNRIRGIKHEIYSIAGHDFDLNSTQQLGVILFDELKIPYPPKTPRTKTGHYQTNNEILEKISERSPIVKLILTYRGYLKVKSTYIENLLTNADENDEVKFKLNQIQADTGRYSASGGDGLDIDGYCGVNCQNIPKFDVEDPHSINLRKALIARKGFKLVSIDYSGEELRIAANFSREKKWIKEFLEGTGDLHTITGQIITRKKIITKKERGLGKCVVRGTLIATYRGWKPIEQLKKGDMVITHKGDVKLIEEIHFMGYNRAIIMETDGGHRIVCGYNHRFLNIYDEWIRAADIMVGSFVKSMSCRAMNPDLYIEINNVKIDIHWAKLFGYMVAINFLVYKKTYFRCIIKEKKISDNFIKIASLIGLPVYSKISLNFWSKKPYWIINAYSDLVSYFCENKDYADRKEVIYKIFKVILCSPRSIMRCFLQSFFEANGFTIGNVSMITTNYGNIIQPLILLLASNNIRGELDTEAYKEHKRGYYTIKFREQDKKYLYNTVDNSLIDEEVSWQTKIISKINIEEQELWDLTISDDHTYIAQGLITHNTINFLTMYGGGAGTFAVQAKIPYNTAKQMVLNFFKEYSGLEKWIKIECKRSKERGYSKTIFGRRRPLVEYYSSTEKGIQAKGDRCAINSAIQGCLVKTERCLTDKYGYLPIYIIKEKKEQGEQLKIWTGISWEDFDVVNRGECQLANIELSNGMLLECDTRHEVLVVGKEGYEFRSFNNIDENTEICVSIPVIQHTGDYPELKGESIVIENIEYWHSISYIIGLIFNKNDIDFKKNIIALKFFYEKDDSIHVLLNNFLSAHNIKSETQSIFKESERSYYSLLVYSKELINLLRYFGIRSGIINKEEIINKIFSFPILMRVFFLKGYHTANEYCSNDIKLLRNIQLLSWTLGIASLIEKKEENRFLLRYHDRKKVEEVLGIPEIPFPAYPEYDEESFPDFMDKAVPVDLIDDFPKIINNRASFDKEVYYHYKLKKKTILNKIEETYTLTVYSTLHRFDSAGIISKNTGADIIKLALWRVYKWIGENNLHEDIKLLLPVHDEILYEIREDMLDMAIPELCRIMKMDDLIKRLKWIIPLEVDAEYGDSFYVDHNFWEEREKLKEEDQKNYNRDNNIIATSPVKEEDQKNFNENDNIISTNHKKKDLLDNTQENRIIERTDIPIGKDVGTNNPNVNYFRNLAVSCNYPDSTETRNNIKIILDQAEQKVTQSFYKDFKLEESIDKYGYFNYPISIDPASASKLRYILEVIRSGGENLFIGVRKKICFISFDGEVLYKSRDELSVDAFLALCILFNV
jgi:DNA polymerase I-like protein with 3'-5' exonuclease and polymerase domains